MGGQVHLQQLEFGKGSALLSVVSGVHGDEYNGLGVCARLARFLRLVEEKQTPYHLQGRIRLLPAANALALTVGERTWPVDHTDLNRLFPGYVAGEATQRLAHLIFEAVRPSQLCVDIHSGGAMAEWPQVRSFSDHPHLVQTCLAAGLPLAWVRSLREVAQSRDMEVVGVRQGTLSTTLQYIGVDSLVLAAGRAQQLDPQLCEILQEGILRLALHLGILRGPELRPRSPIHQVRSLRLVFAERAGLWLPLVALGEQVRRYQPLGEVIDPLTGLVLQQVTASISGQVMSQRSQPLVNSGSLLSRIAMI